MIRGQALAPPRWLPSDSRAIVRLDTVGDSGLSFAQNVWGSHLISITRSS